MQHAEHGSIQHTSRPDIPVIVRVAPSAGMGAVTTLVHATSPGNEGERTHTQASKRDAVHDQLGFERDAQATLQATLQVTLQPTGATAYVQPATSTIAHADAETVAPSCVAGGRWLTHCSATLKRVQHVPATHLTSPLTTQASVSVCLQCDTYQHPCSPRRRQTWVCHPKSFLGQVPLGRSQCRE